MHKIAEFCTKCFSVCPNITSILHTIAIPKIFVKQNNGSNKNCRYVHDLVQHKLHLSHNKCNGSWFVFTKQNINFKLQLPSTFVFFVTKFHGLTLTGARFASTSKVWNHWCYVIKIYGMEITLIDMNSLLNFIKSTSCNVLVRRFGWDTM
jgi:hypothetical protein